MAKNDNFDWCPYCSGSGTVERDGNQETCSACNGTGTINR